MDFDIAVNRVLGSEGGYVNRPDDPGGETNWGISKHSYPDLDIKNLTREQAIEIYRRDFWERINATSLFDGVAFQALDFAAHSGIETAIRGLQRALDISDDGNWGPVSRAAAISMSESDQIMHLTAQRIRFLTRRKNWATDGKGWMERVANNLYYGAEDS